MLGYLYATKAEAQSALDSYKTASSDAANWVPFTETLGYATRTRYVISTSSTGYTAGEAIGYTAFAEVMLEKIQIFMKRFFDFFSW